MNRSSNIVRMKRMLLVAGLFLNQAINAQYSGGSRHGTALSFFSAINNTDTSAFRGGSGDGIINTFIIGIVAPDPSAFGGGGGDGNGQTIFYRTGAGDDFAFRGGGGDGVAKEVFIMTAQGDLVAYAGGSADGSCLAVSMALNATDTVAAKGGRGRGEMSVVVLKYSCGVPGLISVWNGSLSTVWSDAGNWNCGNLPSPASTVIVPSGLTRYPTVFSAAEIRSLQMRPGSTIILLPGIQLIINGQ